MSVFSGCESIHRAPGNDQACCDFRGWSPIAMVSHREVIFRNAEGRFRVGDDTKQTAIRLEVCFGSEASMGLFPDGRSSR